MLPMSPSKPQWAFPTTIQLTPTTAATGRAIPRTITEPKHTRIGYNSYDNPGFSRSNRGRLYYDWFEVEVERHDNGDGFAVGGSEDATITFFGGEDWALGGTIGQ